MLEQRFAEDRWVLLVERATPHDVTYCHYIDIAELRRRESGRAAAAHMTAVAQAFGGLCERLDFLRLEGATEPETPERLRADPRIAVLRAPAGRRARDEGPALAGKLRAVAQRLKLDPEPADLNRLVAETVRKQGLVMPAGVKLEVVEGVGLWEVLADRAAVGMALGELTRNAAEAMEGKGLLVIETANVRVTRDFTAARSGISVGDYVRLSVEDSGTGMSAELAGRALNPFFTSKAPAKHEGLGLSVAYGIARQSGGFLEIDACRDGGTRVELYLPRSVVADGTQGADVHVHPRRAD